jgi:hypothetical protein
MVPKTPNILRMVTETPNRDGQLLLVKHAEGDLFICDVADAVLNDLIPQMEHPFYSLSKKPETAIRRYEHNGNSLQIVPRTERNQQFNAKATPESIQRFYKTADEIPVPLGELMKRLLDTHDAVKGLQKLADERKVPLQVLVKQSLDALERAGMPGS